MGWRGKVQGAYAEAARRRIHLRRYFFGLRLAIVQADAMPAFFR